MGMPVKLDRVNHPAGVHHWRRISREKPIDAPQLEGEESCELVVVGGGFTGLCAATEAARGGLRVLLLEADDIGLASSGRNHGMVVPAHAHSTPSQVETLFGKQYGDRFNRLVAGAAQRIFTIIRQHNIDCDGVQAGWIQPAHSARTLEQAKHAHAQWKALGANVEWLDGPTVQAQLGTASYRGGWAAKSGGHVNPYALACGLARVAVSEGVEIRVNSRVISLKADGPQWQVSTDRGTVRAERVLIATDASTTSLTPNLKSVVVPVAVFQVATVPLRAELRQKIMPLNRGFSDMHRYIVASHYDGAGRLLAGGGHAVRVALARRSFAESRRQLLRLFPQLEDIEMESFWEGMIGFVPDWLPRIMRLAPGLTFAGLYSGRGVALGTSFGAEIGRWLSDTIADVDLPIPVTGQRNIPGHSFVSAVAAGFFPLYRVLDAVAK